MEWIKTEYRHPSSTELRESVTWDFLCAVIIPESGGGFKREYRVLHYDALSKRWNCDEMIITHWMMIPKLQEANI